MLTRLTFRQLEYCVAAGDFGRIAEAAEHIHVSPSSISSAITQVETELSVALFVRHHAQGLSVTPVGHEVLQQMRNLLEQARVLYDVAGNAQGLVRGPLRVGCFTTLAAMVAPELCQGFARMHPDVQVSQIEDHQEGLIERLRRAQIDVAITYDLNMTDSDIAFEALASLPPHVIVGEGSGLATQAFTTLEALADLPMVLLDLPLSRDYFQALFQKAGLTPLIAARSASPDVVRSLVANGVGYSLANVRPRVSHSLDGKRVVDVRLEGEHQAMRLGLASIADRTPRRVEEVFMERCRGLISQDAIPGMALPKSV
ncbi:MAG: LysR family transcriptional regulator [Pigmentiphaga sp.]|nr:LysR family transcriptional regulator [Pigmentiphaga sp.]